MSSAKKNLPQPGCIGMQGMSFESLAQCKKRDEFFILIFIVSFYSYITLINQFYLCVSNIFMNKTRPNLLYKFFV
jgi:hypothetical protein